MQKEKTLSQSPEEEGMLAEVVVVVQNLEVVEEDEVEEMALEEDRVAVAAAEEDLAGVVAVAVEEGMVAVQGLVLEDQVLVGWEEEELVAEGEGWGDAQTGITLKVKRPNRTLIESDRFK